MKLVTFCLSFCFVYAASAQIADSSFFPSVRSINPGVAHQRTQSLVSFDISKTKVEKDHEVTTGGIVGGIQTDVDLQKNTLFYAGRAGFMGIELLADRETGEKVENINSTTYGKRRVANKASSNYFGGIFDFKFLGFSYAAANYSTNYKFRVGEPPSVSAKDLKTDIDYSMLKVGTALNFNGFTFGVFGMQKNSEEQYAYTFYDPSSGAKGTTEEWPAKGKSSGFGVGLGYTSKTFRFEVSTEQMSKTDLKHSQPQSVDIMKEAPASSRLSVAVEARFGKLSLGGRVRNNVGNYTDMEDLISSNLLYGEMGKSESRLDKSFNFGFGSDKGSTFSAFYSLSEVKTEEESTIFQNGTKYPATTTSTAFGGNISYYF